MQKSSRTFRLSFPILNYLAVSDDKTAYAIEKALKIERHTVLESLSFLLKAGLVKISDRKKLPTHFEKKLYRITPRGVVALLEAHPEHVKLRNQDIRDIAEKHTTFLPLVFGKWDYFRKRSVEQAACRFLLTAVQRNTASEIEVLAEIMENPQNAEFSMAKVIQATQTSEPVHRHDIYEVMLVQAWANQDSDENTKWLEVIRGDKELIHMAEREIERLRNKIEEAQQFWIDCLATLQRKKPKYVHFDLPLFRDPRGEQTWEGFNAVMEYRQAKALDDGKPIPTQRDVTNSAIAWYNKQVEDLQRAGKWKGPDEFFARMKTSPKWKTAEEYLVSLH